MGHLRLLQLCNNSIICKIIFSVLLYSFLIFVNYALASDPPSLFSEAPVSNKQKVAISKNTSSRVVKINVELFSKLSQISQKTQSKRQDLLVNLFDDISIVIKNRNSYMTSSGNSIWAGELKNIKGGTAIFVVQPNNKVFGTIDIPKIGSFSIQPSDDGSHVINKIDRNSFVNDEIDFILAKKAQKKRSASILARSVEPSNDDGSIIDILVGYDQASINGDGAVAAADAQAYAELFIAYTNQTYENSGINQRVWLTGVEGFDYEDTDNTSQSNDLNAALNGDITNLREKRNEYHADLVVFFVPYTGSSCGGIASLQVSTDDPTWDFGYSAMEACSFGQSVFAHELGHNMGSRHDWFVDAGTTPAAIGHGHIDTQEGVRTIMSYGNRCSSLGISCDRVPYFSNPSVSYNGVPLGVPSGTSIQCAAGDPNPTVNCDADNATHFNNKAVTTSKFRDSRLTWTGAIDSNWFNAANWTINEGVLGNTTVVNRIPRTFDNVFIPSGLANYPQISGSASARELVIEQGASLDMVSGTLSVGWSWEDNGGFNATGGTVIFTGPIGLGITSSSSFNHVQVGTGSDTSKVTLESNLDINGNLVINAGSTLVANNYTIHIAGNWTELDATAFNKGTSTVIFDGTSQVISKISNTSLLNEDFSDYDASCCGSSLPSGWSTSNGSFFQGGLIQTGNGAANRWRNQTDGYLYTPALQLEPGVIYQLQYATAIRQNFTNNDGTLSPQTISVHLGTAASPTAMTAVLSAETDETSTSYQTHTISGITVSTSGTYYIALRAQQTGNDYASFDDISITGISSQSFHNLHITNGVTSITGDVNISNDMKVDSAGKINFAGHNVSVEGDVINNGSIIQTKNISSGNTTQFASIKNGADTVNKYYGIEVTPSTGDLGDTTVEIRGNQFCSASTPASRGVKRCYIVTPTTSQAASIKFFYETNESNSNSTPDVYLESGGSWLQQNVPTHGGSGIALWTATDLTNYGVLALSNNIGPDQDNDGIPDYWEDLYNLNSQSSSDAGFDGDMDGLNNLLEYQNNTDPNNGDSDGDGMSDGDEIATGRDPNDPSDAVNAGNTIIPIIMRLLLQ